MKSKILVGVLAALALGTTVYAQSAHEHGAAAGGSGTAEHASPPAAGSASGMQGQGGMEGMHGMHGMHGQGMGGMHGMHGMHGMQGMRGMRFPPGYEKLELEMHAEMMESMARIMKKYAGKLPDKE